MTLDLSQTIESIEVLENYVESIRPDEKLREQLDISYKIENQSIIIFEIRQDFYNPGTRVEHPVAKATFIKSKNIWKLYWMRANAKWYHYEPAPFVRTLKAFVAIVEKDQLGCFWG